MVIAANGLVYMRRSGLARLGNEPRILERSSEEMDGIPGPWGAFVAHGCTSVHAAHCRGIALVHT
jgi:hypothetical protein